MQMIPHQTLGLWLIFTILPVLLPGLNKFNPIFFLFKKEFDGLFLP